MWTIVKFDKKKIEDLKKNFNKKLVVILFFTFLKIKIQRNSKNKIKIMILMFLEITLSAIIKIFQIIQFYIH